MFSLIRLIVGIVILAGIIWCGSTVKLGNRTAFGHISAIWKSPEGKDLRKGVAKKAGEVRHDVGELLRDDDKPKADAGLPHSTPAPQPR